MPDASWIADAPGVDALRALGARLQTPELIVFPVRHHSPACAWQLRRLLERTPVSAVLVEGPRSFTRLIPQLTHGQARMPLAIYGYCVFKGSGETPARRLAAYYPFCDHSPELVALRHAAAREVPARFIDLDPAEQFALDLEEQGDELARSLLDERHLQRSRYLAHLAQRLGCRNHEELWEHLFEAPAVTRSVEEHIADMAAYCQLSRIEHGDDELRADGTLAREAEMAAAIAEALAQREPGAGPVLAVVGGFHAVVLPELVAAGTKRPALKTPAVEDQSAALIRYSQERLDRLNGYSSGMTSPAWHQGLWERMLKRGKAGVDVGAKLRREQTLAVLFDVAAELRDKHRMPLPMPTLGAAYEQALRLAALRGRDAPLREDLLDAVTSCFVKGELDAEGALVLGVMRRQLGGQAIGQVPPGTDRPPLLRDFEARARRQRLKIDDPQPRRLVLDLYRRQDHRLTSRLLLGVSLLGVPLAVRVSGPDFVNGMGLARLQEHWEYSYSAMTEAALVEASVYGTTLPLAVTNRFEVRLQRLTDGEDPRNAGAAAALLVQACVLGLHDHLRAVMGTLLQVVGEEASFESVAKACSVLGLLWESCEPLEARQLSELPALLAACFQRAMFLGRDLRGAEGDGSGLIEGLSRLRELLISGAGRGLDAGLFWQLLEYLQAQHDLSLIRGAAAGLRHCSGQLDAAELEVLLGGHLQGGVSPGEAVAFLRGLLSTARETAWQQPRLMEALDGRLREWDEAAFVSVLPELRLAFAEMTPKETDRIAQAVAGLHGRDGPGPLVRHDIDAASVQLNLGHSAQLLERLRSDGLGAWLQS
ncbi:DUF5682 family protein [Paucibacter sp. R3-3]|uniref:DUF5682 family protein n=1 Tax=Roseateles agri TaxID=3098619 RepID=A0ABU5DHK0_9BURK|nr:DUF5682 family protein [Paucibacter sp. R3-3]MDY0745761.1 DUF5682 family protein [Paucibacter sp. R3-3]